MHGHLYVKFDCFDSNLDKEFVLVRYGGEVCMFVCLMCMYVAVEYNSTEREFKRPILISVQLLCFGSTPCV